MVGWIWCRYQTFTFAADVLTILPKYTSLCTTTISEPVGVGGCSFELVSSVDYQSDVCDAHVSACFIM